MAGLGPCLSSHPKRATLLEESFSLDITWWSKSTRKVSENVCHGLCKHLSLRSRVPPLGHYGALTPRRVRVSPNAKSCVDHEELFSGEIWYPTRSGRLQLHGLMCEK